MNQIHRKTSFILHLALLLVMLATLSFVNQPTVSAQANISFEQSTLEGLTGIGNPTTLQFGPDDRLYVAQRYGTIFALTIERLGPGNYNVVDQEEIDLIWEDIPNRDDDGTINQSTGFLATKRQVTGLVVAGTAENPVIYVSSSDPREGGGNTGKNTDLDTNSGVVSRLTWNGNDWEHLQLVRGLPRSEENHSVNGMVLDEVNNILYVTVGGFTNMGAPSFNFLLVPEYAYAAAIITVDLDMIGDTEYDMPTLDDPTRANNPDGSDINDPWGGNDGLNQARIDPDGPVQLYATGLRNPYDVVITEAGLMYTIDNGPNYNWGGPPVNQNPGQCDQTVNEADSGSYQDNLHFIDGPGYYAGHPAPVRANPEGIYGAGNEADSPVPFALANPVECDYRLPGVEDGALATWGFSTNGLTEYTATNFEGQMQGDLLTVAYDGAVYRAKLSQDGDSLIDLTPDDPDDWGYETLFDGFGVVPLDVTAQGDDDIFPGTIWVAVFVDQKITVFEPVDFPCSGEYDFILDEDGDGFTNADEIDNDTNPCSSGSQPQDNDGDFISDLNDPDDDNDGILDINDPFQIDPLNGTQTTLPVRYDFFQDDPGVGFFGVGYTGLMVNYSTDYLDMFVPEELTIGGTAGKATVDTLTEGTAYGADNTQDYAWQWGVNVTQADGPFAINAQMNGLFFTPSPEPGDQQGIYFGNGDQDNYFELSLATDQDTGQVGFVVIVEIGGVPTRTFYPVADAHLSSKINLYMSIDPVVGTVQPKYSLDDSPFVDLGTPISLTGVLLDVVQTEQVMAVGLMAHIGPGTTPFGATWDYMFIEPEQPGILSASPSPLVYANVLQGTQLDQTITVQNMGQAGDQVIEVQSLTITGSDDFTVQDDTPFTLNPGEEGDILVSYLPMDFGADNATIEIVHDGLNSPTLVELAGNSIIEFDPIYRVNVGGPVLDDPSDVLDWSADNAANPSPYANHDVNDSSIFGTGTTIDMTSPTLPAGTPQQLFQTARWDANNGDAGAMTYDFPVDNGTYEVRIYVAEIFTGVTAAGQRVFDVEIEGIVDDPFDDVDRYALSGFGAGYMLSTETSVDDGSLTVRLLHQVQNPEIQGIEIVPVFVPPTSELSVSDNPLAFGDVSTGEDSTQTLTLTNTGDATDPAIVINGISYSGDDADDFSDDLSAPVTLQPGDMLDVQVTINPTAGGTKNAIMTIDHDGGNAPTEVSLSALAFQSGVLEVSPDPLDFGAVSLGSVSTLPLTLTNLGADTDADIEVTNLVVTGSNTYQFQFEDTADPLIIPAGQSVIVDVTFTPQAVGDYSVTISVAHDGVDSPVMINATASGFETISGPIYRIDVGGPGATDPAGILDWAPDNAGSPSPYLAAGGNKLSATGTTIDTSNSTVPADTPMSIFQTERWNNNNGYENAMRYEFPVDEGTYEVRLYLSEFYTGITGAGQRVFDVEVEGGVDTVFDDIDPYGLAGFATGYVVSNQVLVSDGNLSVRFLHDIENPAVKGIEILLVDDTSDALLVSDATALDFGTVAIGEDATQAVTLSHDGDAGSPPLTISTIDFDSAEFSSDFVGPTTLNQGESVTVNVTFTPATSGAKTAALTIVNDGVQGDLTVDLLGVGETSDALLASDATTLDFGAVAVGEDATQAVTFSHDGDAGSPPLTISTIDFDSAEFSSDFVGPTTLNQGESVTVNVTFTPATSGVQTATMTVNHDGVNEPFTLDLTGAGSQNGMLAQDVTEVDFGSVVTNGVINGSVTITNLGVAGDNDLMVTALSISGVDAADFSVTNTLPITLIPGASQTLDLVFQPATLGEKTATLTIVNDGTQGDLMVDLLGEAVESVPSSGPIYRIDVGGPGAIDPAGILDWAPDNAGSPSPYLAAGGNKLSATGATIDTSNPTVPADTPMSIFQTERWDNNDGYQNAMLYEFPVDEGMYEVRLYLAEFYTGITGAGQRIYDVELEGSVPAVFSDVDPYSLAGFATGYVIKSQVLVSDGSLSVRFLHLLENPAVTGIEILPANDTAEALLASDATALDYGAVAIGDDAAQAVTLSHDGDAGSPPLTISAIDFDSAEFSSDFVGATTLNQGESVTVNVTFTPTTPGIKNAIMTVDHDGVNELFTVSLTGSGSQNGILAQDINEVDFGSVVTNQVVNRSVTVTNLGVTGDDDLTITDLDIAGVDADDFSVLNTLPIILVPGESQTLDLVFQSATAGAKTATLTIVNDGAQGDLTVDLFGEAVGYSFNPIYRVDVGGPGAIDPVGILNWARDSVGLPSPYLEAGGNKFTATNTTIDTSSPTIPANTPALIFQTERWDNNDGYQNAMFYEFPVSEGMYEVRLYLAEFYTGITGAGQRVFDVEIEGSVPAEFDDIDPYGLAGFATGYVVYSQVMVTDGALGVRFLHNVQNPAVTGIEIVSVSDTPQVLLSSDATELDFGAVAIGDDATQVITLSHGGDVGSSPLTISSVDFGDGAFTSDFVAPVVLEQGESVEVTVTFAPTVNDTTNTNMTITHDGINAPTTIPLTGSGTQANMLDADVLAVDFGTVNIATSADSSFTLSNLGIPTDPAITITDLVFAGDDAADFSHNMTLPLVIAGGESQVIDLSFLPATVGTKTAQLTIISDSGEDDLVINLTGNATGASLTASALVRIETYNDIYTSSTYTPFSFYIENTSTGGEEIVSVSFDISTAIVPKLVFDPFGVAGDTTARCLLPYDTTPIETGFIEPADLCVDPFSVPYELGYNVLSAEFNDFQLGETFEFGVDVDPISTRGTPAPGPDHAASVSGYELLGSTVTIVFDDGSILTTELGRYDDSVTGSQNIASVNDLATPSIEVLGIPVTPATVADANQTVRVSGPVGAEVVIYQSEGEMVEQAGGGYNVEPYEINTVLNVAEYVATIGAGGTVDVPITLLDDALIDGTYGGVNYLVAVIRDGNQTSALSNRIILDYDGSVLPTPALVFADNITFTAQEGQALTLGDAVGSSADDASTPEITLSAIDDATGIAPTWLSVPATVTAGNAVTVDVDVLGLTPGTYTATVTGSADGYSDASFTVTLTVNDLTVTIVAPTDSEIIVGDSVTIEWTSTGGLPDDHIHVHLDDLSTPAVEPYVGSLPLNDSYTVTGVAPGTYEVIVSMANVNHLPYQGVETRITITVEAPVTPDLTFGGDATLTAEAGQAGTVDALVSSGTSDASTPEITLSAIDDATGIAPTWLSVPATVPAGTDITVSGDASGLIAGTYTATVTGNAGGYNNATFTVIFTVTEPAVTPALTFGGNATLNAEAGQAGTVDALVSSGTSDASTPEITLSAIDDATGIAPTWLSVPATIPAGTDITVSGDASGLIAGTYTATVTGSAGGYNDASFTVTFTVTEPVVTPDLTFGGDVNLTAQEGQGVMYEFFTASTSDASTPEITLNAIDDATGLEPVWLDVESPYTVGNNGLMIIEPATLTSGIYTATVTGSADGYNDDSFTVTLTINDSEIAITAPTDGAVITGNSVTVEWASSGTVSGDYVKVTLDDQSTPAVEPFVEIVLSAGSYTFNGVNPGAYTVIVELVNIAGTPYQGVSDSVTITTEAIPAVTLGDDVALSAQRGQVSDITGSLITGTSDGTTPTINLTVIDTFTQIQPDWLTIPTTVTAGQPINFVMDTMDLLPGEYVITVTGSADGYQDATATLTLTVVNTRIDITAPIEYASILGDSVTVQWTSTNELPTDSVSVTLDNLATGAVEPAVTGQLSDGSYTFNGVDTGVYNVIVQLTDSGGNSYYAVIDTHEISVDPASNIPTYVSNFIAPIGATNNAYPVFQWEPVPNATWYYIWLNTPQGWYAEWVNAGQNCNGPVCTYDFKTALGDGAYEWAIRTSNASGNGPWSLVYDFTINGGVVNPVTTYDVPDSASINPTFSWEAQDGATWYYLWVSGPDGLVHEVWYPSESVCQLDLCRIAPTLNLTPGTYSFWVQHWGPAYLYSQWSVERTFTMTAAPQPPVLTTPMGTISESNPTFMWQTAPGASWHYIWISDGNSTVWHAEWYQVASTCDVNGICSITPTLDLPDGPYNWWVQGYGNGYTYGPWSAPMGFTVDTGVQANGSIQPLSIEPMSADTGTDDQTDTGTDDQTDTGTGDQTDTGTGDQTDTGTGDQTDTGTGDQTDTGTGDQTDTGTGD
ncbi:MAG: choice-of-anchor D domain-containing protein [Anaerolineae bacterium]